MTFLFWLSLITIFYTYAGYPLAIAALARLRPRPWLRQAWPVTAHPPLSIVMAVHNGGTQLQSKLDHLLELDPTLVHEVIVVSDGSTDRTSNILALASDARLKPLVLRDQVGKAAAVNRGIAMAAGEILLFVDLRPRITDGALASLLANFADPQVGCVAGELVLNTEGHDPTVSAVSELYWRYEQWIRNCEAAVDSPVGVYGGFYAVRRSLATQAPPGLILDDMFQPLCVIRQGYRSVLDRSAEVVDMWPPQAAGEFKRKVRTLAGNFQLLALAPWLITLQNRLLFQLLSHKLLRLAVPWLLALLLLSTLFLGSHSASFRGFAFLQILFWAMAAAALRWRLPGLQRIAAPASALLLLNAAAVAGLYTYLFTPGPLWKIWSPTPHALLDTPATVARNPQ